MRQTQNTQKNSNKKSVFVIALLLLLVAVIGFGGYTMSKYISSKKDSGKASVAKWGFEVTANGNGLFGADYKYDTDKGASVVNTPSGTTLTVSAASAGEGVNRSNLVAPGTAGSMTFSIKGSAEVRSRVAINLTANSDVVLKYTATGVADGTYAPVKWTLKKNGTNVTGAVGVDLATLAGKLNSTTDYAPNSAAIDDTYTIEWAWAFETGSSETEKALNNALDTFLGTIANKPATTTDGTYTKVEEGTHTAISFDLSVSVTQLQK